MPATLDFLSNPAPRDIGVDTYDAIRRLLDEPLEEPAPWDDEPTQPGGGE